MAKLCAILSIAVLATLAGCSKEEDAEVKEMKSSISKVTTQLRAEEEKLRTEKRAIEARLDTIDLRIRQMDALGSAMDKEAMPLNTAAASKKEEKSPQDKALDKFEYERVKKALKDIEDRNMKRELDEARKLEDQKRATPEKPVAPAEAPKK